MKLFVSFSGLLSAIANNKVGPEDLDTGLFYFGCVRDHAFHPDGGNAYDERIALKERGVPAHEKLVAALTKAEAEGRARWFRPELGTLLPPYTLLNELLVANGITPLDFGDEGFELAHYSYPTVREMMEKVQGRRADVLF